MGLLDNNTPQSYYQGIDHGNYQFVSLEDIINQFMVVYVGEEKLIPKVKRIDVAFHAQRAMQELSFDTFKSIKSQEIVLPQSLTMILPQDYVNYTKLSWSDSSGIKHILYPASKTSNPLKILQDDHGNYEFTPNFELTQNNDFDDGLVSPWATSNISSFIDGRAGRMDRIHISGGRLAIQTHPKLGSVQSLMVGGSANTDAGKADSVFGSIYSVWQAIDVRLVDELNISASGESAATTYVTGSSGTISDEGILRFGVSSTQPNPYTNPSPSHPKPAFGINPPDLGYLEWADGNASASTKTLDGIDVSDYETVWVMISSTTKWNDLTYVNDASEDLTASPPENDGHMLGFTNNITGTSGTDIAYQYNYNYTGNTATNYIDNISVTSESTSDLISRGNSTTWTNYKSATPSENQNSYDDDTYLDWRSERYGLDPQHAQVNGSFYIDNLRGLINFSSNISGKTVILDYISDSLGTDGEMQVHKFAEEAMYKWLSHAILATKSNIPEYLVARYKRERFAAIRQAKLRLSNIKLEELIQILRGKSKHIKH